MRALVATAFLALALAAPAAHADAPVLAGCIGAGCEFASAPLALCAAAATSPESHYLAFSRGCIARRDFSRVAGPRATAPASASDGGRITVDVFGFVEPDAGPAPTLEARFAGALVQGNPEVAGGKIRRGAYYALGMYWGSDPLTFLYYNLRYGLFE